MLLIRSAPILDLEVLSFEYFRTPKPAVAGFTFGSTKLLVLISRSCWESRSCTMLCSWILFSSVFLLPSSSYCKQSRSFAISSSLACESSRSFFWILFLRMNFRRYSSSSSCGLLFLRRKNECFCESLDLRRVRKLGDFEMLGVDGAGYAEVLLLAEVIDSYSRLCVEGAPVFL